ncbi:anti-lipopolysaccharide factor isoform 1 [Penaeus vannamei]|uniref:Anti-lipopolysaccharide factor isoform 1 n=1 Tax=Penaeus vannamei TaxID=6689 RepID=A0A3R7P2Z4_PENVA|nr:anti-lipopolysaccharide factor isoform 1 [Penaeus vannamei]
MVLSVVSSSYGSSVIYLTSSNVRIRNSVIPDASFQLVQLAYKRRSGTLDDQFAASRPEHLPTSHQRKKIMKLSFLVGVVALVAAVGLLATPCQGQVWETLIPLITQQVVGLWKTGEREMFGHECTYFVTPKVKSFELYFKGRMTCPTLSNLFLPFALTMYISFSFFSLHLSLPSRFPFQLPPIPLLIFFPASLLQLFPVSHSLYHDLTLTSLFLNLFSFFSSLSFYPSPPHLSHSQLPPIPSLLSSFPPSLFSYYSCLPHSLLP